MDYSPIKKLKLKEAFADHSKFRSVRSDEDYLAELFEWSDRGTIFIHDDADAGYSVFITDTKNLGADKMFKVSNPSLNKINSTPGGRCHKPLYYLTQGIF